MQKASYCNWSSISLAVCPAWTAKISIDVNSDSDMMIHNNFHRIYENDNVIS